ncbi:Na/Pi cotransporter family protein [Teredinibacter haidensis]|uniref:Na/Pi cotransporter family protein n=1 Tax=Teredinibacter haidensis TaxID=2731755 RepID=UPI0009489D14|nr:Na/Pi cotransporter family protein [Teredinibacter haidensis]
MTDPTLATTLNISAIVTGLGGGLALFLFGMRQMTESLKTVAGDGMKNLLARLTSNRFSAALAGTMITGVIQSSSVTTVLIVGFISAGLLNLSQSIGVIIGANIGTTITAQIIAFKIYKYGLLMIAFGFLMDIAARNERVKQWGMAIMGLGLIFFGMELMSSATGPLREWPPFITALQNMQSPFTGILAGMVFTAVVQSSSATTGIVIVLASQGLITLESGIALIFGANIGTCVTAAISAVGRPREAVQAAWVHIIFNAGGVLLWVLFIPQLSDLIRYLSPAAADINAIATDTPRQIANAHTLFNIGNALLFIGFTVPIARLVERLVPRKTVAVETIEALYLDRYYLEQPSVALDQTRRELVRLAEFGRGTLSRAFRVVTEGSLSQVNNLLKEDDRVDQLHGAIISYLGKLSQKNLVEPQPTQLSNYIAIANYIENLADVMEENLLNCARERIELNLKISPVTIKSLRPLYEEVCHAYDAMLSALKTGDAASAKKAVLSKERVNQAAVEVNKHLTGRLVASEPNRLAAYKVEIDITENLKRINTLTRRIARLLRDDPDLNAEAAPNEEPRSRISP